MRTFLARCLVPYLPYPHFMGVAPLDGVLRLLWRAQGGIPPRYWPRLAILILLSALSTVASLPERLILGLWLRLRPPPMTRDNAPVFVLGYFRSGTTFLQNLLAADPSFKSPTWPQVLAPQTFVLGWTILRCLFWPLLPLTRLGAVTPMRAGQPAEDDFALNNLGGMSILGGRAVLPRSQAFFNRFHDLDALSASEFDRWRTHQLAFVRKLTLLAGGRRLLLKSPSHTARVRHLLDLFPGAKFVHISRPHEQVLGSNLQLSHELQRAFALQPPLPVDEQAEIVASEYLTTEMHYVSDRGLIPSGDLAELRLQDLAADPVGEIRRVYRELGLSFSPDCEERILQVASRFGGRAAARSRPEPIQRPNALVARLEPLATLFGHAPALDRDVPESGAIDTGRHAGDIGA